MGADVGTRSPTYRIIAVADLPMPHSLFKCKFRERFRQLRDECGDGQLAAVRFYGQLTDSERASCDYHQFDWAAIARRSVEIIEQVGTEPGRDAVDGAIAESDLPKMEKWFPALIAQVRADLPEWRPIWQRTAPGVRAPLLRCRARGHHRLRLGVTPVARTWCAAARHRSRRRQWR